MNKSTCINLSENRMRFLLRDSLPRNVIEFNVYSVGVDKKG